MSVRYIPVGWNVNKLVYDAALAVAVVAYLAIFLHVAQQSPPAPYDDATIRMRAYGSCAFVMLSLVLCIGPLARLDSQFLPLLYNRRHFGVATFVVAATHASFVLGWYFGFSSTDPYVALLTSNTSFGRIAGFPFELFGVAALIVLFLLAATSHDFWLSFLTPPLWKALHMAVYGAYACVVAHVALGALMAPALQPLAYVVVGCALVVATLHVLAARKQAALDRPSPEEGGWIVVGPPERIAEGRAVVVPLAGAESVAVFRNAGKVSAIANACAHQNGPLGEGRIIDGCVTCPWHGFQYRLEDGCAPAPFTEKIATYNLRLRAGKIELDPRPNPPGCRAEPLDVKGAPT
ncbi:MAG: ferric reductase-like transmembrane domain-containing protein [Hyphomicrobiales bacterium]|nr:ferric reductase-like transmembrane domain-containing protein [Hyphomicrobiales bacterium]